jgi:hypothetical protein
VAAPFEPAAAAERLIALRVQKSQIEGESKSDNQPAGRTPDERGSVETVLGKLSGASIAEAIAEIKSPTPAAA